MGYGHGEREGSEGHVVRVQRVWGLFALIVRRSEMPLVDWLALTW